ncbi:MULTISPECIES: hypothetical protein, partial [unclassified Methylophaga]|jgi:hypothetical protein|uniref:hypothetical protein n=1 Tax=unclassified Methylophaga TaxID=2629249 RepID=UPI00259D0340|tara:strand:+ start:5259 stop:5516 length:258 start_codon:yes stop_codon:yes gene_type:complete
MNKQFRSLQMQQTQESLEEFMNFMSFRCDCSGVRILSIETTEQAAIRDEAERSGKVVSIGSRRRTKPVTVTISKELRFNDQNIHS